MFWFVICCLIVGFLSFIFYKTKVEPAWKYPDIYKIPGPPTYFLLGNIPQLVNPSTNLQISLDWAKQYGKMYRLWLGPTQPIVVLTEPSTAKIFLRSTTNLTKSSMYDFLSPYLGNGLVMNTGDPWRKMRKLLTGAFHAKILQKYFSVYIEQANILLARLEPIADTGRPIEVVRVMSELALDIISQCACNFPMNAQSYPISFASSNSSQSSHSSSFAESLRYVVDESIQRVTKIWLWPDLIYFRTDNGKKYAQGLNKLHGMAEELITSRQQQLEAKRKEIRAGSKSQTIEEEKLDFLDILLTCNDQYQENADGEVTEDTTSPVAEKSNLTLQQIRDEVDVFMFAGHDTTSHALAFALLSLAQRRDIQVTLQREIDSLLGDCDEPLLKDLDNFPFLGAVAKETLRLYAPVPVVSRQLDIGVTIDGLYIPKGANVTVRPFVIHRNPAVWSDPESFKPERFLGSNPENIDEPFAHIPFSAGPRNCIGSKFATNELKAVLIMIMKKFTVTLGKTLDGEPDPDLPELVLQPSIVLSPKNGIQLYFWKRVKII